MKSYFRKGKHWSYAVTCFSGTKDSSIFEVDLKSRDDTEKLIMSVVYTTVYWICANVCCLSFGGVDFFLTITKNSETIGLGHLAFWDLILASWELTEDNQEKLLITLGRACVIFSWKPLAQQMLTSSEVVYHYTEVCSAGWISLNVIIRNEQLQLHNAVVGLDLSLKSLNAHHLEMVKT